MLPEVATIRAFHMRPHIARHVHRYRHVSRGVNDPTGQARGHPARAATGSFTPRLACRHRTSWLRHGRLTAPPDRGDAIATCCVRSALERCSAGSRARFTVVDRVVNANGRGTTYGAPGLSPQLLRFPVSSNADQGGELQVLA